MSSNSALIPLGWRIERLRDPVLKTIVVHAPKGYAAVVTVLDRNPANVLYLLAEALLNEPVLKVYNDGEDG
jgi:hypothetical protein